MQANESEKQTVSGHADDGTPTTCTDDGCAAAVSRSDRWMGPHCSMEESGRAHFHHADILRANVQADHAAKFAEICHEIDDNPEDFVVAWEYLSRHPLFHRPYPPAHYGTFIENPTSEQLEELRDPNFIEDCDGLRDMLVVVFRDEEGGTVVALEHGPHLWVCDINFAEWTRFPAAGQNTYDPELDVSAATYEEAVVALAKNVRGRYGDDRANVTTPLSVNSKRGPSNNSTSSPA